MKTPLSPLQAKIRETILTYVKINDGYKPTRWEVINYLIGYYGMVNRDHIIAINEAVREGKVTL